MNVDTEKNISQSENKYILVVYTGIYNTRNSLKTPLNSFLIEFNSLMFWNFIFIYENYGYSIIDE